MTYKRMMFVLYTCNCRPFGGTKNDNTKMILHPCPIFRLLPKANRAQADCVSPQTSRLTEGYSKGMQYDLMYISISNVFVLVEKLYTCGLLVICFKLYES